MGITHVMTILLLHNGSYGAVTTQEYNTKDTCEKARVKLLSDHKSLNIHLANKLIITCTPK